jgi:hypothetical protein
MRTRVAMVLAAAACFAAVGCGEPSDSTPVACLEGAGTYLTALEHAPAAVKLRGETPISDCLAENQQAGDLATVGTAMVAATTRLNAEARAEPGGDANLQLGYLLGAVERGAQRTDGIHAELARRLSAAARYSPDNRPLPPAFLSAYREGFDAGQAHG